MRESPTRSEKEAQEEIQATRVHWEREEEKRTRTEEAIEASGLQGHIPSITI